MFTALEPSCVLRLIFKLSLPVENLTRNTRIRLWIRFMLSACCILPGQALSLRLGLGKLGLSPGIHPSRVP
eukprot:241734-Amorphochlora_amoeboformis.AAC.1